ncbi:MAG: OmpA family protein [Magnetococcales bacterium]|nr:OmpA family protein [Magnetococcales bacterium]
MPGAPVDRYGCPVIPDADGDGVADVWDMCPDTPATAKVDMHGCPIDSDRDGVPDYKDDCPNTAPGVAVNAFGCPLDTDEDGVINGADKCDNSARGDKVSSTGCSVAPKAVIKFALGSAGLSASERKVLNELAKTIKANPGVRVDIQGHADESGSAASNVSLSMKRAKEVRAYLKGQGVKDAQLTKVGYGATRPAAYNLTSDKRRQPENRRVEIYFLSDSYSIRESDSTR